MKRFGAIAVQPRRSSPNDLFASPDSGWAKSRSIEQSRTSTFFDGLVTFGGLRVYWYASVSTRKSGILLVDLRGDGVAQADPRAGLRAFFLQRPPRSPAHWQGPCVSFWLMEIMPAVGVLARQLQRLGDELLLHLGDSSGRAATRSAACRRASRTTPDAWRNARSAGRGENDV